MKITRSLLISLTLLLVSCAHTYKGEVPKFDGPKKKQQQEFSNFQFKEGYWSQHSDAFTMSSKEELYTLDSLEPVIDKVGSQMFKEEMKNANLTQSIGLGLLVGAIGMLFLSEDVKDWNSGQKTAYWSLLGLSVASNYLSFHFINNAAKEHNKSLKQKLNLGLEASLRY